ncbi:MAG: response regulator [Proteobacteria bacterium]|nr:response regulator [Pseudomonadota bacterium]
MKRNAAPNSQATAGRIDPYKVLFDFAPDGILVVDAAGRIRLNNAEAERLLDAAPGELHGLPVDRLVPMGSRRVHGPLRAQFLVEKQRRPMGIGRTLRAVKLSGREFPVEISLAPTEGDDGAEVIVTLRDVSDRLLARQKERELERARALTRISQLALRERHFDRVGEQATQLAAAPLGADAVLLLRRAHGSDSATCTNAAGPMAAPLVGLVVSDTEHLLCGSILRSGAPALIGDVEAGNLKICPALIAAGMRSLMLAVIGNPEHQHSILVAASRVPHHFATDDIAFLEAIANIASNALQRAEVEDKLLISQRLESLGQLTGGVAHDFNNLLTVISGNLQILEDTVTVDPFAQRAIASAQRATKRGAELTGKLLAFSRRQTLMPAPIQIPELLAAFRDLLARTLGPNVEIIVSAERDLPLAMADSGQLETALLNLAVNARDAMPSGGKLSIEASAITIDAASVSAADDLRPGDYIRLSVSDTGSGMSRETLARAFEPFFTTKAVGKGSGLGLSMVYGFAKQSAGHVTVYSEVGIGTTFNVFLPVAPAATAAPSAARRRTATASTGDEAVLVVEDDVDVRAVAQRYLTALGYRVFVANNRRTASARLRAHPDIALLFTDVVLEGDETGPRVAASLQRIKPSLHVLYASGYARSALPLQWGLDEHIAFLRKPYSREQLGQAVRQALDGEATTDGAAPKSALARRRSVQRVRVSE